MTTQSLPVPFTVDMIDWNELWFKGWGYDHDAIRETVAEELYEGEIPASQVDVREVWGRQIPWCPGWCGEGHDRHFWEVQSQQRGAGRYTVGKLRDERA